MVNKTFIIIIVTTKTKITAVIESVNLMIIIFNQLKLEIIIAMFVKINSE